MTRDSLRPLEGRLVYYEARPADAKRHGDDRHVLLKGVRVWAWDGNQHVGRGEPHARLDHVGVTTPVAARIHLLRESCGPARVGWSARKGGRGTVDLGLEVVHAVPLDQASAELFAHTRTGHQSRPEAALEVVETLLCAIEEGVAYSPRCR